GPGSRGNKVDKTLRGGQSGRDLTIGELAVRTDSTVSALHFYERQGLLAPHRTGGNQRRYPASAVAVVGFIRSARQAGIPLSLIREVLRCRQPAAQPAQRACARLCAEVSARELALRQVRSHLSGPACHHSGTSRP
ncbi:MAG: MerR family transcriptional regulator, redox-sensitive transcriptional activator SoxR, partial [Pseudonocardiales bacterium]|nr:MerR family transcriptional regulator, redox-sensitive transcriptional activator SoxR [Pseudonocardiales bacterium]